MGLQGQVNDVSSDSIPLLLISLIAKTVANLRCFLLTLLHTAGISRLSSRSTDYDGDFMTSLGSGLAGVILLTEQLNVNRIKSFVYEGEGEGNDCVVCLTTIRDGDLVRRLDCCHVFHKHCFDGWLDHNNFNCPLCRSPLVSDQRVGFTRLRVGGDLLSGLSAR